MRCPHCRGHIPSSATAIRQRWAREGLCIDDKAPLTEQERAAGYVRCFTCRQHKTELTRRRLQRAA